MFYSTGWNKWRKSEDFLIALVDFNIYYLFSHKKKKNGWGGVERRKTRRIWGGVELEREDREKKGVLRIGKRINFWEMKKGKS